MTTPVDNNALAARADELFRELFPICRSITGDGVRQTLKILSREIPELEIREVPTGTKVFDWTIPGEWLPRGATLRTESGDLIADFSECNLHLVSYSAPFTGVLSYEELLERLHTLPGLPDAIPYRTSYYKEDWGICLSHREFKKLNPDDRYKVEIDTEFRDGALTYGETKLEGGSGQEYLISTYCCHPSMANDNLSGPILTALLYSELKKRELRNTYRFAIVPETIGAITYLKQHEADIGRVNGALVVTTAAGPGPLGYKETFHGNDIIDRAIGRAFVDRGIEPIVYPFAPDGSDERQYSSPGFRIPTASITKDKYYEYDYYHTSLDDLEFVSGQALVQSLNLYLDVIAILEHNVSPINTLPHGEVQLGIRGLYPQTGGAQQQTAAGGSISTVSDVDVTMWILFLADGEHDLLSIADRSGASFEQVLRLADRLRDGGTLRYPFKTDRE